MSNYNSINFLTYTFSRTMPLAWEAPPKGLAFRAVPKWAFLYCLSCHFCSRRWFRSFLAVRRPRHLPVKMKNTAFLNKRSGWEKLKMLNYATRSNHVSGVCTASALFTRT